MASFLDDVDAAFPSGKDMRALVVREANSQGYDPRKALVVAGLESDYNPRATSPKGAAGVMQLMPETAARFGVTDSYDPQQNIRGGIRYLKHLETLFPERADLQFAAYHAGEGAVKEAGGIPDTSDGNMTTAQYVKKLLRKLGAAMGPRNASASEKPSGGAGRSFLDAVDAAFPAQSPTPEQRQEADQGRRLTTGAPDADAMAQRVTPTFTPPAQSAASIEGAPPETPGIARLKVDIPYGDISVASDVSQPQDAQVRTADEAIMRQYGYDPALITQASQYRPGALIGEVQPFGAPEAGVAKNLAQRAGVGLAKVGASIEQGIKTGLGAVGLQQPADVALADLRAKMLEKYSRAVQEQSPTGLGYAAEAAGSLLFPLPQVPGLGNARRTVQIASEGIKKLPALQVISAGAKIAAAEGAKAAVALAPATNVSPNPEERTGSYLGEKATQAAYGGAFGGILDIGMRAGGATARWLVNQSRGAKALNTANEANLANENAYLGDVARVTEQNQMAKDAYRAKAEAVLAQNETAMSRHQVEVATINARNRAAQEAYEGKVQGAHLVDQQRVADAQAQQQAYASRIAAHEEAIAGARGVPGKYGPETLPGIREAVAREPITGNVTDTLYARLRNVAGDSPVITKAAQEAAENVSLGLAQHATPGSGGPLEKIAGTIRNLGSQATVEDIVPLLQDAGKLMRSQDGNTRSAARNLFVGLHEALEQSAEKLPETAMARTLLQQATMAARRGFAVDDLSGLVRAAIRYNKDGTAQSLNVGGILTALERRFEGTNPRDKLFARSFTPEERASILDDFRKFRGLPEIGKRPVALSDVPSASSLPGEAPLPAPLPVKPQLKPLPELPTLEAMPPRPEVVSPQLEGLGGIRLLKDVALGGVPAALYTRGNMGRTAAAAAAVVAGDALSYAFARAILNPHLRPLIFRALDASGTISPAVYGLLGERYHSDYQSLGETKP